MIVDVCSGKNIDLKTAQKLKRLCGPSLPIRVGSPMILLLTCTPSLTETWPGSTIEMRSIRHFWPLCWCCGPGLWAYGRKRFSARAYCFKDYAVRERNRMYRLTWPSAHGNLTIACMVQTPKTNKCSASSTTDAGWPRKRANLEFGKNFSFCNQKTDSQLQLYVYGCFLC